MAQLLCVIVNSVVDKIFLNKISCDVVAYKLITIKCIVDSRTLHLNENETCLILYKNAFRMFIF